MADHSIYQYLNWLSLKTDASSYNTGFYRRVCVGGLLKRSSRIGCLFRGQVTSAEPLSGDGELG